MRDQNSQIKSNQIKALFICSVVKKQETLALRAILTEQYNKVKVVTTM